MPLPSNYIGSGLVTPLRVGNVISATTKSKTPGQPNATDPLIGCMMYFRLVAPAIQAITDYISTGFLGPNAATATQLVAGADWDGTYGTTGIPDFPRNVVITVTHGSAVIAESGVITGVDLYGRVMTESWSVTAGTTSKTFTGKKAFASLTSITFIAATDASGNTNKVGTGKAFGLPFIADCIVPTQELEFGDAVSTTVGTTPTAGVIVRGQAAVTTADPRGTYAPNSAQDAAKCFQMYYMCNNPSITTNV